jgi:hypothetical protein
VPDNVQTMAYYGPPPWHGLGTEVRKGVAAEEVILAAGLDWTVELRPARGAKPVNGPGEDVVRWGSRQQSEGTRKGSGTRCELLA